MSRNYDVARNTRRWPMVIFYGLLNTIGINTFCIYRFNNPEIKIKRYTFIQNFAWDLIKPQILRRSQVPNISKEIKNRAKILLKIPANEENVSTVPPAASRGRCFQCGRGRNKMTRRHCAKCHKWMCPDHLKDLCTLCFSTI